MQFSVKSYATEGTAGTISTKDLLNKEKIVSSKIRRMEKSEQQWVYLHESSHSCVSRGTFLHDRLYASLAGLEEVFLIHPIFFHLRFHEFRTMHTRESRASECQDETFQSTYL